jgi:hypothetical protein
MGDSKRYNSRTWRPYHKNDVAILATSDYHVMNEGRSNWRLEKIAL